MAQGSAPYQAPMPYGGQSGVKYCESCGTTNDLQAAYCTKCGGAVFRTQPAGMPVSKPAGVIIIGILEIIFAALAILSGLSFSLLLPFGAVFSLVIAAIGVILMIAAISLFSGHNWARIFNIVIAAISLIAFPVGTIIGVIVLVYLTRPHVVAYFRT